ncbi:hypothetical protein [Amycolatopsis mongoliensis]|uniref:hypothetical protein n=1 Tax=Amycolatopsis mongoliensis TaxID=715475 RepID=UPI002FCD594C
MNTPKSSRKTGTEVKALKWLFRHPGATVAPTAVLGSGLELGWTATGGIAGGTAGTLLCWYRAHPDTFDHYAAPRLRAWRRRWSAYFGPRFTRALRACDMYVIDRKTGEDLFPGSPGCAPTPRRWTWSRWRWRVGRLAGRSRRTSNGSRTRCGCSGSRSSTRSPATSR